MDANAFRQFYDYHFAENRKIWDSCIVPLKPEQFIQNVSYPMARSATRCAHYERG